MYKVQNITPGNVPVDLEQGSIILQSGKFLDLDLHCSRKWIKHNNILRILLGSGALRLVHDSEEKVIIAPPISHPRQRESKPAIGKTKPTKKHEKPVVIDLSVEEASKPAPKPAPKVEAKDPIEELLSAKSEEKPKNKRTYTRKKKKEEVVEEKPKKKRSYFSRTKNDEEE